MDDMIKTTYHRTPQSGFRTKYLCQYLFKTKHHFFVTYRGEFYKIYFCYICSEMKNIISPM